MVETGQLPMMVGVHDVDVYHDDWCAIFRGGWCNCDPWIRVHEGTEAEAGCLDGYRHIESKLPKVEKTE
nr:hypothetical protein [Chloroflexota bacterium]